MNRIIPALLTMAAAIGAIQPARAEPAKADAAGRAVAAPARAPQRIVIGSGPLLYAMMAIEAGAGNEDRGTSRIIAVGGDFTARDKAGAALLGVRYPALRTVPAVKFGEIAGLDGQGVLALKPDLAILSGSEATPKPGSLAATLIAAGVPVVFTDFRSHPGKNSETSLRAIATALGHDPDSNRFLRFRAAELAKVSNIVAPLGTAARPRVFFDMRAEAGKPCCGTPGKGNYGELIEAAGGHNIGAEIHDKPLGRAELAQVLARRPDIYVAGSSNGAGVPLGRGVEAARAAAALATLTKARTELAPLPAMTNGRAFAVWHSFYNHPFNVAVIRAMAKQFHGDRFATLDPQATLNAAYGFVGIEPGGTYWTALQP